MGARKMFMGMIVRTEHFRGRLGPPSLPRGWGGTGKAVQGVVCVLQEGGLLSRQVLPLELSRQRPEVAVPRECGSDCTHTEGQQGRVEGTRESLVGPCRRAGVHMERSMDFAAS